MGKTMIIDDDVNIKAAMSMEVLHVWTRNGFKCQVSRKTKQSISIADLVKFG